MAEDLDKLRDLVLGGNASSLDPLLLNRDYEQIRIEAELFLKRLVKNDSEKFDTIIGLERKGLRILRDVFPHDSLRAAIVSNDELDMRQVRRKLVRRKRVLIFDDSTKTGNHLIQAVHEVLGLKPKSVSVACLLTNEDCIQRLHETFPDIPMQSCKAPFESYQRQAVEYMAWELAFQSGLRAKDNPDYPIVVLRTVGADLTTIRETLNSAICKVATMDQEFDIDSIANTRHSIGVTIDLTPDVSVIPEPFRSMCEFDGGKIRYWATDYGKFIETRIQPIVNPRFSLDRCEIAGFPKFCVNKTSKIRLLISLGRVVGRDRREDVCAACAPTMLNAVYALSCVREIEKVFAEKQIKVTWKEVGPPKFRRFFHARVGQ